MALASWLTEILICPKSKTKLVYLEDENLLFTPEANIKYRIEDDLPVLLVEEGEALSDAEAERLKSVARGRGLI